MSTILIKGAKIVNEGEKFKGSILIENDKIKKIYKSIPKATADVEINAEGLICMPGIIDDQVHFREPGLTHKAELYTEAKAAVAGGITSFMEMPNTVPNTLTQDLLEEKYQRAAEVSLANYSFFMGASNDNLEEVLKTDPKTVCGVKVFMGASTGNMLVDDEYTLTDLFSSCKTLIATHCEDEPTIRTNAANYKKMYGEDVPITCHPEIRSEEACYRSSSKAAELASKYNTRLHILHISTAKELSLFSNDKPIEEKRITSEACIHHLWFTDKDYETKGSLIKWNPAVKTQQDRDAILQAVNDNVIDIIATDHAPHTLEEKGQTYFKAPSGGPLVQHALPAMMELHHQKKITLEHIVQKMCHDPARIFDIGDRGYIREGYKADLVLVNPTKEWKVGKENILYKCGWSPFEGQEFKAAVEKTFVNGHLAYDNGTFNESQKGERLFFDR